MFEPIVNQTYAGIVSYGFGNERIIVWCWAYDLSDIKFIVWFDKAQCKEREAETSLNEMRTYINDMTTTTNEYTAKIVQQIKDDKLTSEDNESYRLKVREMYHRRLKHKSLCPTCGKLLSQRVFKFRHKFKCAPQTHQATTNSCNILHYKIGARWCYDVDEHRLKGLILIFVNHERTVDCTRCFHPSTSNSRKQHRDPPDQIVGNLVRRQIHRGWQFRNNISYVH